MSVIGTDLSDIDLLDPDAFVRMEHHEWFTRLRAEDPVHWYEDDPGEGFWNLTKYDDVVLVNRDSALFSSQIGGTQIFSRRRAAEMGIDVDEAEQYAGRGVIMLEMDPPKHTRYRLLVNKGFTPRMIGLLNQALRTRATHIIDQVIEKGEGDFVTEIASELPLQAIAEIMGVPQEDRMKLFEWSNSMIGAGDPEFMNENSGNAMVELFAYANNLAETRRADPRDDIVTKLLNAEIEGDKLSRARVRHVHVAPRGGRQRDHAQRDRARYVRAPHQPRAVRLAEGGSRRSDRPGDGRDPPLGVTGAALQAHRHRRHRDPRPGDQGRRRRS